jgi:hypothetical protein
MNRHGPPSFTTGPKTRSRSAKSSGFNFKCWLVKIALGLIAYKRI